MDPRSSAPFRRALRARPMPKVGRNEPCPVGRAQVQALPRRLAASQRLNGSGKRPFHVVAAVLIDFPRADSDRANGRPAAHLARRMGIPRRQIGIRLNVRCRPSRASCMRNWALKWVAVRIGRWGGYDTPTRIREILIETWVVREFKR